MELCDLQILSIGAEISGIEEETHGGTPSSLERVSLAVTKNNLACLMAEINSWRIRFN